MASFRSAAKARLIVRRQFVRSPGRGVHETHHERESAFTRRQLSDNMPRSETSVNGVSAAANYELRLV
jgi:hypothetical protein